MSDDAHTAMKRCPNCGRDVEAGFKYCDRCGTDLSVAAAEPVVQEPGSARKPPLVERWRRRRRERAEAAESPAPVVEDHPEPERAPAATPVPTSPVGPRLTSKPMRAEELQSGEHRPAIGGRLQWRDKEEVPADAAARSAAPQAEPDRTAPVDLTPAWRPIPRKDEVEESPKARSPVMTVVVFLLHLVLAFAAGAAVLGVAAIVASLVSNGRVALLEVRGLPIFIAGAIAIVVFSLLRTGSKAGDRRAVAISILAGFILLVVAVAAVYRPSLMASAQQRLDQTLGVFGPRVAESVDRFAADVDQWNAEVDRYRLEHLTALDEARDQAQDTETRARAEEVFRVDASRSEEALDGILKRMRSHAEDVEHEPLRAALNDLAEVFGDELAGIRLITRGFVNADQALISSGNARFKDATARAVEVFDERVEPILRRGDIDPEPMERAVAQLLRG